jgi:hypothetical protein
MDRAAMRPSNMLVVFDEQLMKGQNTKSASRNAVLTERSDRNAWKPGAGHDWENKAATRL